MTTGGGWVEAGRAWPEHSKKWFRDALRIVKRAGWQYNEGGDASHGPGGVYCRRIDANFIPTEDDDGSDCYFPIYSSGRGGETAASELIRLARNCPHLGEEHRGQLEEAKRLISDGLRLVAAANRLHDAAEAQSDADRLHARADELIVEALTKVEGVEAMLTLDEADQILLDAESEASEVASHACDVDSLAKEARADAASFLRGNEASGSPAGLVERAEASAQQAAVAARRLPEPKTAVTELKARLADLKSQLRTVRRRLS